VKINEGNKIQVIQKNDEKKRTTKDIQIIQVTDHAF